MKLLSEMTEPEIRDLMNAVATAVLLVAEAKGVEKPLFALLLFNDPALAQYVANCRREDVILAFEESACRLRRNEDVAR